MQTEEIAHLSNIDSNPNAAEDNSLYKNFINKYKLNEDDIDAILRKALEERDNKGNNIFLSEAKSSNISFFIECLQKLYSITDFNPADHIDKILNKRNHDRLSVIDLLTINGSKDCLKRLFQELNKHKYALKEDMLQPAITFAENYVEKHNEVPNLGSITDSIQVIKAQLDKAKKPVEYDKRGKSFSSTWYLKQHISARHQEVKSHPCPQCGKTFTQKGYLKKHISARHQGVKSDPCPQCGKTFTQKGYLKQHISAIHGEVKSHPCPQCSKTFTQKRYLKQHISTCHQGVKSHPCPQCSKTFTQKGYLKKHISARHQGVKSDPCPQCSKTFTQKGYLKKHISARHQGVAP